MYKNSSILNFFKPFTQPPRLNKRSPPEDNFEEPRPIRRSRASTPNDSQTEQGLGREEEPLGRRPPTTSPRVTLTSSNTRPPGAQVEEPMDDATPTQAFREETSYVAPMPVPCDTISRNADVLGSQSTSLTSSQRVVRKGEIVITNSDDDSDSASSLEDLNDLLLLEGRGPRGEPSHPDPQIPASPLNGKAEDGRRMSTRRRTRSDQVAMPPPSALPVQSRKYKFDLESLAKQRKREEASIGDVAEANAMVNSFEQQKASGGGSAGAASIKRSFDATFIDVVMKEHQDEDEVSRLKAAIRRTEALHHGKSWSFFEEQADSLPKQSDFPTIEDDRLGRILRETSSRQQAFLNGYVGELAMRGTLPEELLLWILEAMCLEARDDLRYSYTITLTDASQHLASVLSPQRIDILFRKMGATAAALDIEGSVTPHAALSQTCESVTRPSLLSILGLFKDSASKLCTESRIHLIYILCRLVLDHSILNNCHIMNAVEGAFTSLIESIPEQDLDYELRTVMTSAFKCITDATLRLRLLQNICATSHRLILLRRRLALACFFQDIGYLSQQADDAIDLKDIVKHLEGPQFMISNATDYGDLAARIGILSIAIDGSGSRSSSSVTKGENGFNREIDVLSLKIKSMFADIVDTGASHMGRTEAKEVLEAFQYRLSYGVRTKPPPKQSLFGDSTVESALNRHMMEAFIEKGRQNTSFARPDSVQRQGKLATVAAS